jgi:hypothetical protein
MPFLNGIADAVILPPAKSTDLVEIMEIKASKSPEWQENALLQSILYGICLGKSLFRVHLVNVFFKESCSYVVQFGKEFFEVRDQVVADVQQWNLNCFLAKNVTYHDPLKKNMNLHNTFFLDGRRTPKEGDPTFFLTEIVSPTKTYTHPMTDWKKELPQKIRDFGITKIVVGRHLSDMDWKAEFPDHPEFVELFRPLKFSQKCFTLEGSWQHFLTEMGWYAHEYDKEQKKSYLEWDKPQCTMMVQWAHLCTKYNFVT